MKLTDKSFIDWEVEYFGFGYGTGEEFTLKALKKFFSKFGNGYDHRDVEKAFGELSAWLLINILCGADIIEYGTSPRFGWFTEKGELLRDYIKSKKNDELYNLIMDTDENYIYCGKDYCNCGKESKLEKCINNQLF